MTDDRRGKRVKADGLIEGQDDILPGMHWGRFVAMQTEAAAGLWPDIFRHGASGPWSSADSRSCYELQRLMAPVGRDEDRQARRVKVLAVQFGMAMGLSQKELDALAQAALVRDIGHIAVPGQVLVQKGPLTALEREMVKLHPLISYRILMACCHVSSVIQAVLAHHERWDGNGYPRQKKGSDIPLNARIISIVDAFDAMTQGRPYRRPVSNAKALWELERCAGSQFDPELVDIYLQLMDDAR